MLIGTSAMVAALALGSGAAPGQQQQGQQGGQQQGQQGAARQGAADQNSPNMLVLIIPDVEVRLPPEQRARPVSAEALYKGVRASRLMDQNVYGPNGNQIGEVQDIFVNADGQKARLSGGGNAVPSMAGLDDIVLEGGVPANAKYFTEVASKAYAVPEVIARSAKVGTNFGTTFDGLVKGGADAKTFATKMAAFINAGG